MPHVQFWQRYVPVNECHGSGLILRQDYFEPTRYIDMLPSIQAWAECDWLIIYGLHL